MNFIPKFTTQHATLNDDADDSKNLDKNHLVLLDGGETLADNEKEEGNESHIHSIKCTRNIENWRNTLAIHDLPLIDPLQEGNIILSLNVSKG